MGQTNIDTYEAEFYFLSINKIEYLHVLNGLCILTIIVSLCLLDHTVQEQSDRRTDPIFLENCGWSFLILKIEG